MRGRGFLFFLLYCLLNLIDQYALNVNGNSVIYLYYIFFYLLYFILFGMFFILLICTNLDVYAATFERFFLL